MDKLCGVYKIENIITKDFYIGSSANVEKRVRYHTNLASLPHRKHTSKLQKSFDKYGCENFVYDVLLICDSDMLIWYEQQCIDKFKPQYNIRSVAHKVIFTDDTKHKMSVARKGIIYTDETRRRMSESLIGNKRCVGRKMSTETKQKISASVKCNHVGMQGKKHSDETKRKISNAIRKYWETRRMENIE